MAKIPDNFFDEIEAMMDTPAPIVVPRGWAVDEDDEPEEFSDDDDQGDDGPFVHTPDDEGEEEDILPVSPVVDPETYDDGTVAAPLPPVRAKPKRAFVDDDFDDEPVVRRPKGAARRGFVVDDFDDEEEEQVPKRVAAVIEDFSDEEEEQVLKPRLTVGPDGSPVVHLDDDEVTEVVMANTDAAEADYPGDEVDDEPEEVVPYVAPARQEKIVPVKRLSEKALLVSLNISQWNGRRFDRAVSDEVNARKAAVADAGRFNKVLLPGCEQLAEVHRQTSSLRNWFVAQTLPWMNDGARITPSSTYLAFTAEFRQRKAEWIRAVDALIAAYPALLAKAPAQLKDMFNRDDYPGTVELRRKFGMDIRAFPLPDKEDFRVELDPATLAALKDSMSDVEGDLARQVVGECYTRLGKAVGAMAERLSQPDAVFRNSLTENLAEAVMALKDLNITGDPKLEALRVHVAKSLGGYTADELRADGAARKAAADTAKAVVNDISSRMAGLI